VGTNKSIYASRHMSVFFVLPYICSSDCLKPDDVIPRVRHNKSLYLYVNDITGAQQNSLLHLCAIQQEYTKEP
jgi:hypothetical protein